MKKYCIIILLLLTQGCYKNEAIKPIGWHVDLTRNEQLVKIWKFVLPEVDYILPSPSKDPWVSNDFVFYKPFPEYISGPGQFGLRFHLTSLNKLNTLYLRATEYLPDPTIDWNIAYVYDTLEVQTWNNDSIICKIPGSTYSSTNDSIWYFPYVFHGKYNHKTGNIDGFVDNCYVSYRCPTCPSHTNVYIPYFPAMFQATYF